MKKSSLKIVGVMAFAMVVILFMQSYPNSKTNEKENKTMKSALIVVDVQNDFCPGGTLAVPKGDEVVPIINDLMETTLKSQIDLVVFSRDYHPADCDHFKKWPPHCIQNTKGAGFHAGLRFPKGSVVISKGMDIHDDAYSAFEGCTDAGVSLEEGLKDSKIERLFVVGLATDYCVRSTVLDALSKGFEVVVVIDACRAVNLSAGDGPNAIMEMLDAGASIVHISALN
ncbi:MAG: nicotinamidase [Patescibacteria group bacterium]|jgi:nicotinamidase/pyrazinamidase